MIPLFGTDVGTVVLSQTQMLLVAYYSVSDFFCFQITLRNLPDKIDNKQRVNKFFNDFLYGISDR